jgi:hypothetical protein
LQFRGFALRGRISFQVDEAQRIAWLRYYGDLQGDALLNEIKAGVEGVDAPWTYDFVIDMRRFEGVTMLNDLTSFAAYWAELCGSEDKGHFTAVITTNPLVRARMNVTSALFPKDVIEAFDTLDEGLEWIIQARSQGLKACAE